MKSLTLIAAVTGLTAVASAQSFNPPTFNWRLLNQVANAGFESPTISPWTQAGS